MFSLSDIYRFNQGSFFEQNLVSNAHQGISHVVFNFSDQLYSVKKEIFKQSLSDISLVCA